MNTRSQPGFVFEPLANRFPPSAPSCYPAYNFQSPMLNSAVNSQASVRSVHIQPNQAYGFMLPNALPLLASTSIIAPAAIATPTAQPVQSTASASTSNSSRGYRIGGKSFFLTYPHWNLDLNVVLTALQEKLTFDRYIIAREKHFSGDPHIHVYLSRNAVKETRNPRFFEILGFHGNYQVCRSSKSVQVYVVKGNDYITNIPNSEFPHKKTTSVQKYFAAATYEDALEVARNSNDLGRDYIRNSILFEKSNRNLKDRPVEENLEPFKDPSFRFIHPRGIKNSNRTKQALM
ncbi:Replication-associated protein A [Smittium culicis]|uniref:Replication-associated protein A n=1 Tax=Smittium culicis TaxID=133412 RepID=A0A1R1XZZ7_9FUNG|nr:Replication-associated protein A [Smittium culicis]